MIHLTNEAKARELAAWEALKQGPRGEGGRGFPDDDIIPLCDALNALEGVCTLQSCAGHPASDRDTVSHGHVWLWLSCDLFESFLPSAARLARDSMIEGVSLLWGRYNDNRAVVAIDFLGMAKDTDALVAATGTIFTHVSTLHSRAWVEVYNEYAPFNTTRLTERLHALALANKPVVIEARQLNNLVARIRTNTHPTTPLALPGADPQRKDGTP